MAYAVGVILGLVIGAMTRLVGMDRDRALYPVAMIVIASYYALFAVMGGSTPALVHELLAGGVFLALALVGYRSSLWLVAAALVGHGLFDFFVHGSLIDNPGMPPWWPAFCGAVDVTLGAILAWLIKSGRVH